MKLEAPRGQCGPISRRGQVGAHQRSLLAIFSFAAVLGQGPCRAWDQDMQVERDASGSSLCRICGITSPGEPLPRLDRADTSSCFSLLLKGILTLGESLRPASWGHLAKLRVLGQCCLPLRAWHAGLDTWVGSACCTHLGCLGVWPRPPHTICPGPWRPLLKQLCVLWDVGPGLPWLGVTQPRTAESRLLLGLGPGCGFRQCRPHPRGCSWIEQGSARAFILLPVGTGERYLCTLSALSGYQVQDQGPIGQVSGESR